MWTNFILWWRTWLIKYVYPLKFIWYNKFKIPNNIFLNLIFGICIFISICISSFIVDGLFHHWTLVSMGLGNVTYRMAKFFKKTRAHTHELQVYYEPLRIYQYLTLTIKEVLINVQYKPHSFILKETLNIIQGNTHHK